MRLRVLWILAVLAALVALPAPALAASAGVPSRHVVIHLNAAQAAHLRSQLHFWRLVSPYHALGPLHLGGVTVSGTVYTYDGTASPPPMVGADVYGYGTDSSAQTTTDSSGVFQLTGLGAATNDGGMLISPSGGDFTFGYINKTWSDPATVPFGAIYPGRLKTTVTRSGPWGIYWWGVEVQLFGDFPYTDQWLYANDPDPSMSPTTAAPGTYSLAAYNYYGYNFYSDEGMEADITGTTVPDHAFSGTTLAPNEALASRTWVNTYWASGNAGAREPVVLRNFPVGWVNQCYGYSEKPGSALHSYGSVTSSTTGSQIIRPLVPANATPGYAYYFELSHKTGPLRIFCTYQVCTLKPSKTIIRRGAAIRLSGIIPTANSQGNHPGPLKWVYLYKRYTNAAQPNRWPSPRGWSLVARYKANIHGIYSTGLLKPTRTTYYVAHYSGDSDYWAAYTSVTRVVVH